MGLYDTFRNRVALTGNNEAQAYENATIQFINQSFSGAPNFATIQVNGTSVDVRLMRDEKDPDNAHAKRIALRPNTVIQEGSYANFNSKTWLVDEFDPHPYYPTAHLMECGQTFQWKLKDGTLKTYPCALNPQPPSSRLLEDAEILQEVRFSTRLFVQYNVDTETVKEGLRIIIQGKPFMVIGVDPATFVYNGVGFISVIIQTTTVNKNDDLVNGIADNTMYYNGNNNDPSNGGGWNWTKP